MALSENFLSSTFMRLFVLVSMDEVGVSVCPTAFQCLFLTFKNQSWVSSFVYVFGYPLWVWGEIISLFEMVLLRGIWDSVNKMFNFSFLSFGFYLRKIQLVNTAFKWDREDRQHFTTEKYFKQPLRCHEI